MKKPSPEPQTETTPAAPVPEPSTEIQPATEKKTLETSANNASKSLFETIVITVPNPGTANPKTRPIITTDKEKPLDQKNIAETERPRIVAEEKTDGETEKKSEAAVEKDRSMQNNCQPGKYLAD